jgi:hypothetical protein
MHEHVQLKKIQAGRVAQVGPEFNPSIAKKIIPLGMVVGV